MNARSVSSGVLMLALSICGTAAANAANDAATPPVHHVITTKKFASARKPPAAKPAAVKTAGAAPTAAQEKSGGLPRRLDEINIEGEIAVPQVLFVTARDQRRFMDFQQRRYVKSSLEVGTEKIFPTWIAVIHSPTEGPHKETNP